MDLAYAVDLARGWAPLTFDRDANPDGLAPQILTGPGGRYLRLAVQAGVYPHATRGEPDRCDRCEMREPCKLPMGTTAWHALALRIPRDFPLTGERFVALQVKANGGGSPLLALRVARRRLYADWRVGGVTIAHHPLADIGPCWTDIVIGFGPTSAELWADGRLLTTAMADFASIASTRYLKIGPYRDRHPCWGAGPAAIEVRHVRRGASRASVTAEMQRAA